MKKEAENFANVCKAIGGEAEGNSCKIDRPQFTSARQVQAHGKSRLIDPFREQAQVYLLDSKNRLISDEIVSLGILNASLLHPREVFRAAIVNHANSIILSHNHPSGDCAPSEEDKQVTLTLKKAGEILGIKVLDHVIFSEDCNYSFSMRGEM